MYRKLYFNCKYTLNGDTATNIHIIILLNFHNNNNQIICLPLLSERTMISDN